MRVPIAMATASLILLGAAAASAQECLHGSSETAEQRGRRDRALTVADRINLAQVVVIGPRAGRPKYKSLEELSGVPATPTGFVLRFHTDGETYLFSIADTLDPCGYTIFSDHRKRVYEATPRTRAVALPAGVPESTGGAQP